MQVWATAVWAVWLPAMLKAASVPGEIHIYPTGGHGWGWNETFKYRDEFRNSLARWLSERLGE